jgi:hypothetical protein
MGRSRGTRRGRRNPGGLQLRDRVRLTTAAARRLPANTDMDSRSRRTHRSTTATYLHYECAIPTLLPPRGLHWFATRAPCRKRWRRSSLAPVRLAGQEYTPRSRSNTRQGPKHSPRSQDARGRRTPVCRDEPSGLHDGRRPSPAPVSMALPGTPPGHRAPQAAPATAAPAVPRRLHPRPKSHPKIQIAANPKILLPVISIRRLDRRPAPQAPASSGATAGPTLATQSRP